VPILGIDFGPIGNLIKRFEKIREASIYTSNYSDNNYTPTE
jgi:hypothetical protein